MENYFSHFFSFALLRNSSTNAHMGKHLGLLAARREKTAIEEKHAHKDKTL